jgi:hypothetical protein
MPIIGTYGGHIGNTNISTKPYASGAWTQEGQYMSRVQDIWPPPDPTIGAGYFAGGVGDASGARTLFNTVDKFEFTNDARTVLVNGLSAARIDPTGFQSAVSGYVAAGNQGGAGNFNSIDKYLFSNDSRTLLSNIIQISHWDSTSFESLAAGYILSGRGAGANVQKVIFSSDTLSVLAVGLSSSRWDPAGVASNVAGYAIGGTDGSTMFNTIDRFTFSNDARTTIAAVLAVVSIEGMADFQSSTAGYTAGGLGSSRLSRIERLTFANETMTTIGATMSEAAWEPTGCNSREAGYIGGGQGNTGLEIAVVDKLTFSSETRSTLASGLSIARWSFSGFNTV